MLPAEAVAPEVEDVAAALVVAVAAVVAPEVELAAVVVVVVVEDDEPEAADAEVEVDEVVVLTPVVPAAELSSPVVPLAPPPQAARSRRVTRAKLPACDWVVIAKTPPMASHEVW